MITTNRNFKSEICLIFLRFMLSKVNYFNIDTPLIFNLIVIIKLSMTPVNDTKNIIPYCRFYICVACKIHIHSI